MTSFISLPWPQDMHKLLVAFSGGADSTALMCLLLNTQDHQQLEAVHVNHGIRGEASDADERFVRAFCEDHHVSLTVYAVHLPADTSEDEARRARYQCFQDAMRKTQADTLVLAHHMEDQAETVLLHLMRGSGLRGLTGMQKETTMQGMRVIRPLLDVSKKALLQYLKAHGQSYCEDQTNQEDHYLRNQLRHQVLPLLESMQAGSIKRIAQTAQTLYDDESYLAGVAEAYLPGPPEDPFFPQEKLQQIPAGLMPRVLRSWWMHVYGATRTEHTLSLEQTQAFCQFLEAPPGSRMNLPGSWQAYRGWQGVHLLPPDQTLPSFAISLEKVAFTGNVGDGKRTQVCPQSLLADAQVRFWTEGDWIRPFGMQGTKSLQDYLVDRHVDAPFRRRIPLLCRGQEVLLVCGVGAGAIPKVSNEEDVCLLVWKGTIPWYQEQRKRSETT